MNKKQRVFAAIIGIFIIASGAALASEPSDLQIVNTAILPQQTLVSNLQIQGLVAPALSLPAKASLAPVQSNFDSQRIFNGFARRARTEKTLFTTSLVAMTALNVADYFSTKSALKLTGLKEGNPLMKPFVKNAVLFAAVKAGTTVLSVWGMKSLYKRDKTTAWILTTASNFLLSYVVANNMRLVQRARIK